MNEETRDMGSTKWTIPFVIAYDPSIYDNRATATRPNPLQCSPPKNNSTPLVPTVLENPSVLLTRLRFFLGGQVRKVEDFTNLCSIEKIDKKSSENECINWGDGWDNIENTCE